MSEEPLTPPRLSPCSSYRAIGTLTPLPHREITEARKALTHRPAHDTLSRAIIATPVAAAIAVIAAIAAVSGKSRIRHAARFTNEPTTPPRHHSPSDDEKTS